MKHPTAPVKLTLRAWKEETVESLNLLKEEINQTQDSEHDFAKWKLIVVAVIGAATLGLEEHGTAQPWLFLFIPFACAYIDLHISQYQLRVFALARFIRSRAPGSDGDTTLQDYEKECENLRLSKPHIFDLGQFANFIASVGLSVAAMVVAVAANWKWPPPKPLPLVAGGILWLAGMALIWIVMIVQQRKLAELQR